MVYCDGREKVIPITNPLGTQTTGYIQCHGQIISQDPFYHLIPKGNFQYLTPKNRVIWNSPKETSTVRSNQVIEKTPYLGLVFNPTFDDLIFSIKVVNKNKNAYPIEKHSQSSFISEQEQSGLISDIYDSSKLGTKNYIQSHGKERISKPYPYGQEYGGSEVITNTYIKNGKENAFVENTDDATYTPIDVHKHSANDLGIRGSTLAGFKARGVLH